jgi:hypothetical protein
MLKLRILEITTRKQFNSQELSEIIGAPLRRVQEALTELSREEKVFKTKQRNCFYYVAVSKTVTPTVLPTYKSISVSYPTIRGYED